MFLQTDQGTFDCLLFTYILILCSLRFDLVEVIKKILALEFSILFSSKQSFFFSIFDSEFFVKFPKF